MAQGSSTELNLQGERALRRSSHDDMEPGLDAMNWGSVLGGSALLAYGMIRRRRFTDVIVAGLGAALAYRGLSNSQLLGRSAKRLVMHTAATHPVEVATSMTVERPVEEVYGFWRKLDNLPRFLGHIASVEELDEGHSRWVARLPTGITLSWHAELIEERDNELLAWQSVKGSDIFNEGFVTFRPLTDGRSTEIHARIVYHPPAGQLGARIVSFFDALQTQVVREDLRSFKRLIETGELPTIQGQSSARAHHGNGRIERMRL